MTVRVAVDLGQGGCRVLVSEAAGATRRVDGPGYRPGDGWESLAATVLRAVGPASGLVIGIGLTGLNGRVPDAGGCARAFAAAGLTGSVALCDDSVTGYLGAVGARSGAVIAAGTGAVAFAVGLPDRSARSDGWGPTLGDRGSGYWIGLEAVRQALRHVDRGEEAALVRLITDRWGPVAGLPERWRSTQPSPDEVASIAPGVADLARAGDAGARAIWSRAGRLLAETTADVLRASGQSAMPVPVVVTGGLIAARDLLAPAFEQSVRQECPEAEVGWSASGPLEGALKLTGAPLPGVLERLVARAAAQATV